MTEQTGGSSVTKGLGGLIGGAIGGLLTWLNTGSSGLGPGLVATAAVLSAIGGVAFSHIYRRYLGVLGSGGARAGSPAREAYDSLRRSLAEGNIAARLYASRLSAFLDQVDRFFGDDKSSYTLFPHAFGLKTPAPLWTASAFDRCLLLAFFYPIATIFLVWTVSGHVGPAEEALRLQLEPSGWRRSLSAIIVFGPPVFAFLMFIRASGWKRGAWLASIGTLLLIGVLTDIYFISSDTGLAWIGFLLISSLFIKGMVDADSSESTYAGAGVGAIVCTAGACVVALTTTGLLSGLLFSSTILLGLAAVWVDRKSIQHGLHGVFLAIFLLATVLMCLGAAKLFGPHTMWKYYGPSFLFLGLLTLINAPFDWVSLGLTRALLRRGLELGGWWPYILALVDAALAAAIIATLAIAMVIGVQAFNGLVIRGGGQPVLPLFPFFDGIETHPTAPEYWWVYALLLSTMIPSLINLIIGGASLLRGIPGLPKLLLSFMPAGKAVPAFDRHWIALVLTVQIFAGAILGVVAQAILAFVMIVYIMPPFGLGLLDMAREVAAFNLPLRIGQFFTRSF